jgi:hypothetical protein
MADEALRWEQIPEGYRAWKGALLLAVLRTAHDKGLARGGAVVWEAMDPPDWRLHLTSPELSVDDLRALAAGVPRQAAGVPRQQQGQQQG